MSTTARKRACNLRLSAGSPETPVKFQSLESHWPASGATFGHVEAFGEARRRVIAHQCVDLHLRHVVENTVAAAEHRLLSASRTGDQAKPKRGAKL